MTLCLVLFYLSVPVCICVALIRLLTTRSGRLVREGKGGAEPFVNRLYSALKRMACCWAAFIAVCVAGSAVLGLVDTGFIPGGRHFLLMVGVALAAFVWGLVLPRAYADGVNRVVSGRRLVWGLLAFYLFFVFVVAFGVMNTVSGVGFRALRSGKGRDMREFVIESPVYDASRFRIAPNAVSVKMIPPRATDIRLEFRPGIMGNALGADAMLRCRVKKADLLEFAQRQGYSFRSDSYTKNECPEGPQDCDFVYSVWGKYNSESVEERLKRNGIILSSAIDRHERYMPKPYPKEFLAYNYRYASCGGHSFLYDVKAETLYACWSSN